MTERSPKGLYLHIPFCRARCGYCDFVTFAGIEDRIDAYVRDLCQEIELHASALPRPSFLSTVFLGGGTPSLLGPHHVGQILGTVRKAFALNPNAEITMEANPESVTGDKAAGWFGAGVNRLSLGLQSYDDRLLKMADRLHTAQDFENAFRSSREAGFRNLNVDLLYGLPSQSLQDWQDTLEKTTTYYPDHLSLYALKVEEHTPFRDSGVRTDEDRQTDMYDWARAYLKQRGYGHYEISNFALPSKECEHNLIYWRQKDYIGAGVGAVGCVGGVRWENHKTLDDYGHDLARGKLPQASREFLSEETRRFERLMLGLRLREGLEWEEPDPDWQGKRRRLAERRLLEVTPEGRWRVPDESVLLTNQALLPFAS